MNTITRVAVPSVPPAYRHCRLENFKPRTPKQRAALAAARAAHDVAHLDESGPVVFTGPVGVGKTHLATALLYAEAAGDDPADWPTNLFVSYPDLAQAWGAPRAKPDIDPLVEAWLLVLDDLAPPTCAAEASALAQVIDLRYRAGDMRLIVTTNLTPPELRQALGDRAFDRLRQGAMTVPIDGASYRARPAAERETG